MCVDDTKLAESEYGDLVYANGELLNKATVNDPVAYRGGGRGRSLVKWSGDHIRPDGKHEELVLDQYKRDEAQLAAGDPMCGEVTRHLRGPGQSGADTLIETVRFDGVVYEVPIIAKKGIIGAVTGRVTRFYTDGGKFCINWQDDTGWPNGVVYDTHDSIDESTWTHVGSVRIDPK